MASWDKRRLRMEARKHPETEVCWAENPGLGPSLRETLGSSSLQGLPGSNECRPPTPILEKKHTTPRAKHP